MYKFPNALIKIGCTNLLPCQIGVFALRNIKKGIILGKADFLGEKLYDRKTYNKLDKITKKRIHDFCGMVYDGFISIPDVNYMPIHYHCNHSCAPNAGFDKNDNLIAIKDIKKNEEIFLDYSFINTDPDFILNCKCNSKNCRKRITGNDWKNHEYYKKNKKYMSL